MIPGSTSSAHAFTGTPSAAPPVAVLWYVIHDGKEEGPLTLNDLIERTALGKIDEADLVKPAGGLWSKAREVGPLQELFRLAQARQKMIDDLGRFHGVWISKKALMVGGGVGAAFVLFSAVYALWPKPTPQQVLIEQKAAALQPALIEQMDAESYAKRGLEWYDKKEYDRAIQDYDEAIRLGRAGKGVSLYWYYERAEAWFEKKQYGKAIQDFDEGLRLHSLPNNFRSTWHIWRRGTALFYNKQYDRAVADFEEILRTEPNDQLCCFQAAVILATCPDKNVRDGKRAIQLARKVCDARRIGWSECPTSVSLLAAAHAEDGQFDEAQSLQRKALAESGENELTEHRYRLELFTQKRPLRNWPNFTP